MFDRITYDPKIMGGRACIRGMRITVSLIVNLVANGMTVAEILREYPDLESEDVRVFKPGMLRNTLVTNLALLPREVGDEIDEPVGREAPPSRSSNLIVKQS